MTASAILLVNSRMARKASSLPGIAHSTTVGSQLVSTTAITGILSLRASITAISSLPESMMNSTSGRCGMSLMPAKLCVKCLRSRSSREISFLERPS